MIVMEGTAPHRNALSSTSRNLLRQSGEVILLLAFLYFGVSGFLETYFPGTSRASGKEWITTNVWAVEKLEEPTCFAVIGGYPVDRRGVRGILAEINQDADIRFTVNLADMMELGQEQEYVDLLDFYQGICRKPLLPAFCTHNQQIPDCGYYALFFGPRYYSFQVGSVYFVMMDTSFLDNITNRQIRWLKGILSKARKNCCRTLVFMNVALADFHDIDERNSLSHPKKADEIREVLERFPPVHVFASHKGRYFPTTLGKGIPYTLTGFSSRAQGTGIVGNKPYFLKVTITSGGLVKSKVITLKQPA